MRRVEGLEFGQFTSACAHIFEIRTFEVEN